MTSRTPQSDGKPLAASQAKAPIKLKDVKLKDRIHLFEGLSSQSAASDNKNTSSNNSEQALYSRYPKVVATEQKRWTQIETQMPKPHVPPWLKRQNENIVKSADGQSTPSPLAHKEAWNRTKTLGSRPQDRMATEKPPLPSKPSELTPTQKKKFVLPGNSAGDIPSRANDTKKDSNAAVPTSRPDTVYIDGTPVKLRNNKIRKCSADCDEARSSVSLMVNNFENLGDDRVTESRAKRNDRALSAIPAGKVQRKSAEIGRMIQGNETRTRQDSESENIKARRIMRRRSKSVSDIYPFRENSPRVSAPPSKPKRTFAHDIYMETKKVITQQENLKKDSSLVNPLYGRNFDEDDDSVIPQAQPGSRFAVDSVRPSSASPALFMDSGDKEKSITKTPVTATRGKVKELPAIPNVPPYSPSQDKSTNQSTKVTDGGSKSREAHLSAMIPPHVTVPPTQMRPRCETAPSSTLERQRGSLQRWFSSEDVSRLASGDSQKLLSLTRKQGSSEYAEPVMTVDVKRSASDVSIFSKPQKRDTVVDEEGYSIPGSHLWKKPEPHAETGKPLDRCDRVPSRKFVRRAGPKPSWRSVHIFVPEENQTTFPGYDDQDGLLEAPLELFRNRKSSSERRRVETHTYTEPGAFPDDDFALGHSVRQRSRLMTMRRKINDAFRRPRHQRPQKDDDRSSLSSQDSGGEVTDTVMHKRISHARAVKKRSSVYCNADKYRRIIKESKLYDYLVIISLEFNQETRRYQPIEKSRYPEELSASQNDKLRAIPHFCFPDAFKWAPVEKYQSESYSFVLTSMDGSRLYGYNRRLLPPGDKPRLPEVYCIITPISCRLLFTQLLDEIERRRMSSKREVEKLIREAYSRNVPPPGGSTTIMQMDVDGRKTSLMKPLILQRPQDSRLEHVDFDCLFSTLKIPQVIQIFASLLLERRVIMCSGKLSKLSKCSQAVAALLYPFAWQHVYVPVLPEKLIDMSCSPTPYIMGMLSLCIPKLDELPIDEVLIVDLDSKDFYTVVGDEETILPRRLSQALERALGEVCSFSFVDANGMEEDMSSDDQEAKNKAISEIFIRYFVETCGHYMNHFSTKYDGNLKFDRETFIKAVTSRSIRRFLEVFTETQMFHLFIQEKEGESEGITQGLFETKVREWEAQSKINANRIGAKMKKIGRAVKDISREGGKKVADTAKDMKTKVKANLDAKV